jgi:hypothetical protein
MDSLDYARLKKKFTHNHHQPTMNLIQNRLNDALQTISKRSFPNFANWRRIRTVIPFTTPTEGDCAAYVFKLLELFDGVNVQLPTGLDVVSTCKFHHFPSATFYYNYQHAYTLWSLPGRWSFSESRNAALHVVPPTQPHSKSPPRNRASDRLDRLESDPELRSTC